MLLGLCNLMLGECHYIQTYREHHRDYLGYLEGIVKAHNTSQLRLVIEILKF